MSKYIAYWGAEGDLHYEVMEDTTEEDALKHAYLCWLVMTYENESLKAEYGVEEWTEELAEEYGL